MTDKERELLSDEDINQIPDGFRYLWAYRQEMELYLNTQVAKLKSLGYEQAWEKCPKCKGEGEIFHRGETDTLKAWSRCSACKGTGKVRTQFKLPEGIEQSIKDTLFDNGVSNRGHITRQILSLIRQDKE